MGANDVVVKPTDPRPVTTPPAVVKKPGTVKKPSTTTKKKTTTKKPKSAETLQKEAEARAKKEADKLRLKTGMRFNQAAIDLKYQIAALKDSINTEFARSRDQNLGDIDMMLQQQFGLLKDDAVKRGAQFLIAALDNEKAAGDTLESGYRNLVRERADSMSAVLEQGAGETDAMRAMLVNARNWHSNASEANRSYFDTAQSINSGINDLNIDTRTALANAHTTAEGQREQTWQDFYNRRAEAMTNLGNTYGTRLEYMEQAKEMGVKIGDVRGKRITDSRKGMEKYYMAASDELGKSYVQQRLPDWVEDYEGTKQVERRQENTNLAAAPVFEKVQKAEGATLRKWAA